MNNIFLNLCKFFKFVQRIIYEKMAVTGEKNDAEKIGINSRPDYLGIRDDSLMRKFSLTDIPGICNELERIINHLRSSTNMEYFLYDYPEILEERLTNNIRELEGLLKEIKSVNSNIQRQTQQQILFTKEKGSLKKALRKLKENEIGEMETVVSLFDKAMFSQWESVKSTRKPEVLERFLSDVMSKQLALDNLNILAARKLTNLKKFPKGKSNSNKKIESNITSILLLENNETDISKIPPPPPLPAFPTWAITNLTNYNIQSPMTDDHVRIESIDEELD